MKKLRLHSGAACKGQCEPIFDVLGPIAETVEETSCKGNANAAHSGCQRRSARVDQCIPRAGQSARLHVCSHS